MHYEAVPLFLRLLNILLFSWILALLWQNKCLNLIKIKAVFFCVLKRKLEKRCGGKERLVFFFSFLIFYYLGSLVCIKGDTILLPFSGSKQKFIFFLLLFFFLRTNCSCPLLLHSAMMERMFMVIFKYKRDTRNAIVET